VIDRVIAESRIQWNDDGSLDEVVTDGGAHLEHMGGKHWFLSCVRADGSEFAIWFKGKITMAEERDPPKGIVNDA
jgi:hypothetical protein